jgi:hypothetical protein
LALCRAKRRRTQDDTVANPANQGGVLPVITAVESGEVLPVIKAVENTDVT